MFGLLRSNKKGRRKEGKDREDYRYSPYATSPETSRRPARYQDEPDDEDERSPGDRGQDRAYFDRDHHQYEDEDEVEEDEDEEDEDNVDEDADGTPLLPIFSAAHLDRLPLYNITHAIRLLIVQKCETTLSWEQLRSPQISNFVVKPIQLQIRNNHFNRATLCALIANALQFYKEAQSAPGNAGVSKSRALLSELLAMRLLKEYTTRELIDALSYDFDPLQGFAPPVMGRSGAPGNALRDDVQAQRVRGKGARVSTIEIAIRAQAKRFLAHPLVVQHLEAIWAGSIVFHSESDNLHRKPLASQDRQRHLRTNGGYGTINEHSPSVLPAEAVISRKAQETRINKTSDKPITRRSVTLYDPRDASLFKLSRLRVPRYRQLFSTLSFAIMLALYIAVLVDRSLYITPLEVVFWFWSIGYMLDEIIGFTEQGFGLYILSFWNAFDLGILLLFVAYYVLRLYGIVLADQGKHRIAAMAYDALASTAVLLFPRLFSVLDHYRYFSQLLIAFRMMAQDLMAILILILISCSGFFVAFTLSFSDDTTDANAVAYALFQILMGFTPAAWEKWHAYNALGKAIMGMFLIICHFLIVTILITVLTNSFMAIVQNANEEHQFLFAVNTISMVKSDALFSYIAPSNVFGWLASPLRYVLPFRQFVKVNRTIIKVTHFPILFVIFSYERVVLSGMAFEPTDLVERPAKSQQTPLAFSLNKAPDLFSPGRRLREPSIISFHKDRALDEVFRQPYRGDTVRTTAIDMDGERRNSTNVVDKWMQIADEEGGASPPMEQPRSIVERLENRRPKFGRAQTSFSNTTRKRDLSTATRSVISDPDFIAPRRPQRIDEEDETMTETGPVETDADGDDENNDDSDIVTPGVGESALSLADKANTDPKDTSEDEFFHTPVAGKSPLMQLSNAAKSRIAEYPVQTAAESSFQAQEFKKRMHHSRQASSGTILYAPQEDSSTSSPPKMTRPSTARQTPTGGTGASTPNPAALLSGQRTPRTKPAPATKARPIMPGRQKTAPVARPGLAFLDMPPRARRAPSFNARALDLASEIGDNKWVSGGGIDAGGISGMPASFSEQLFRERELQRVREEERRRSEDEEKGMVNRIMLARMHTLEEGFREVLKEIKDLSSHAATGSSRRESEIDAPYKISRLRVETAGSSAPSSSVVGVPPKTPIGRIAGNEKSRKSPKKKQGKGAKGKEAERPGTPLRHTSSPSPPSPNSVVAVESEERRKAELEREGETGAGGEADERPGTAFVIDEQKGRRSSQ